MAEAQFVKASGFDKSFKLHAKRNQKLKKSFATFVAAKKQRPPGELPPGFRDHKLSGVLSRFNEVHLGPDSLLIYTDSGGVVTLYRVVSHADVSGSRQQDLAKL